MSRVYSNDLYVYQSSESLTEIMIMTHWGGGWIIIQKEKYGYLQKTKMLTHFQFSETIPYQFDKEG